MLVRIANRIDPDQTASSEVCAVCLGILAGNKCSEILEHLPCENLS